MKNITKITTSALSIIVSPFGWPIALIIAASISFAMITDPARGEETFPPASVGNVAGAVGGPFDTYRRTVILGIDPRRSYVRFANMSDQPVTNIVEVYGLDSESTLGRFQITVPAKASVQVRPDQMIQSLLPLDLDQFLALYVENGHTNQFWQHVQFDQHSGEFADAGVCTYIPDVNFLPPGNVAINVHTTRINWYASFVSVHNFSDVTAAYEVRVYRSATGELMGTTEIDLGPRETLNESGYWFQGAVGWYFLEPNDLHMNVEFVPLAQDDTQRIAVGHVVGDVYEGGTANLSNPCPLIGNGFTRTP